MYKSRRVPSAVCLGFTSCITSITSSAPLPEVLPKYHRCHAVHNNRQLSCWTMTKNMVVLNYRKFICRITKCPTYVLHMWDWNLARKIPIQGASLDACMHSSFRLSPLLWIIFVVTIHHYVAPSSGLYPKCWLLAQLPLIPTLFCTSSDQFSWNLRQRPCISSHCQIHLVSWTRQNGTTIAYLTCLSVTPDKAFQVFERRDSMTGVALSKLLMSKHFTILQIFWQSSSYIVSMPMAWKGLVGPLQLIGPLERSISEIMDLQLTNQIAVFVTTRI